MALLALSSRIDHSLTEADWIQRVREGIDRSVHMQMVSDVPIGAFLSGRRRFQRRGGGHGAPQHRPDPHLRHRL